MGAERSFHVHLVHTAQSGLCELLSTQPWCADIIIPGLHHETRHNVSATGVQLCRVVQSVREGGKCVTRLALQLRIGDDGWWIIEMLKKGCARQLGQRYHGGVRFGYSCTAIGTQLFVVGGLDSKGQMLSSVEKYDSSTNEWTSMAPLATARSYHSCTAIGTQLFVVGGMDNNNKKVASVEMYDSNTDQWL